MVVGANDAYNKPQTLPDLVAVRPVSNEAPEITYHKSPTHPLRRRCLQRRRSSVCGTSRRIYIASARILECAYRRRRKASFSCLPYAVDKRRNGIDDAIERRLAVELKSSSSAAIDICMISARRVAR